MGHYLSDGVKAKLGKVDVFQGNPFGFSAEINPCVNGYCDEVSQCQIQLKENLDTYPEGSYGANGSIIDTNSNFHVKNEFMATSSYANLWGLRMTLS